MWHIGVGANFGRRPDANFVRNSPQEQRIPRNNRITEVGESLKTELSGKISRGKYSLIKTGRNMCMHVKVDENQKLLSIKWRGTVVLAEP